MKRIIAVITVASALVLTGCSQVGAAATVGDTKITEAQIQKSIDAVLSERAKVDTTGMQLETGANFNRNQLRFHLISVLVGKVITDKKITVTKAEIDARRAEILTSLGGEANLPKALVGAGIASADFDEYLQLILYSEKLAKAEMDAGVSEADTGSAIQKLVVDKAKQIGVTVNPKYGKWDPATGDVLPLDAASPAATPAQTP
ncbi:MAG: hypothetical protein Q8L08_07405 [Candidatus Nanopelagicaceae bacterium]|nr:hypothetical protein [Candidatus Nanopelagicaceae bacterium]